MNILEYVDETMSNGYSEEEALTCYEPEYDEDEYDVFEDYRYSVVYNEPLYFGDEEYRGHKGLYGFDTDRWDDIENILNAYGKDVRITVRDNYYDVSYDSFDEEWN